MSGTDEPKERTNADNVRWYLDQLRAQGLREVETMPSLEDVLVDAVVDATLASVERDLPALEQRTERLLHHYGL